MTPRPDPGPVRRRYATAARRYDAHSAVFDEVGRRLLERLDGLRFEPQRIVDLGCGTGRHTRVLAERYPHARLTALDSSRAMLDQARRRRGRWRPRFELVLADFDALPLAEASVDLVFANLALQWSADLTAFLTSLRRIMRPRGLLMMTLPGPDTLIELKRAGALIEDGLHVHAQELGDLFTRTGFQEPVLDTDWLTTTHAQLPHLLAELDQLGLAWHLPDGANALAESLTRQHHDNKLAISWEMIYATAWSPDEGQPIRTDQGEEASVSAASLGIRKRRS